MASKSKFLMDIFDAWYFKLHELICRSVPSDFKKMSLFIIPWHGGYVGHNVNLQETIKLILDILLCFPSLLGIWGVSYENIETFHF